MAICKWLDLVCLIRKISKACLLFWSSYQSAILKSHIFTFLYAAVKD